MSQITIDQLQGLIGCLYDVETSADAVTPAQPIEDKRVVATYNDMDGQLRFAVTCELSLANSLGAALTRIPPGGAEDATSDGEVPANIAENLHEVLNICSTAFADAINNRIVLDKMFLPGDELADGLGEKIASSNCILQANYDVERYQTGKISLLELS